jgi:hypothetical protein
MAEPCDGPYHEPRQLFLEVWRIRHRHPVVRPLLLDLIHQMRWMRRNPGRYPGDWEDERPSP